MRYNLKFLVIKIKSENVILGKFEERSLLTGIHVVCDVYCKGCIILFFKILKCNYKAISLSDGNM